MGREKPLSGFDRIIAQAMGDDRPLGREDDPAREQLPNLWEWLSKVHVGRDYIKAPAILTIQLGPEGVLIRLSDRDLCLSVDVSCTMLQDCLTSVESTLANPALPIRNWGKKEPKLRKRQKSN